MRDICIIEDDEKMVDLLREYFEERDIGLIHYADAEQIDFDNLQRVDVYLVDWILERTTGIKVVKKIRQLFPTSTIIMITSNDTSEEMKCGLSAGANDYIIKPFDIQSLVLKVENALNQHKYSEERTINFVLNTQKLKSGKSILGLKIDCYPETHSVIIDETMIRFTQTEYKIFMLLLEFSEGPLAHSTIVNRLSVAKQHRALSSRSIDVHIVSIRKKISGVGLKINKVRGKGFLLEN